MTHFLSPDDLSPTDTSNWLTTSCDTSTGKTVMDSREGCFNFIGVWNQSQILLPFTIPVYGLNQDFLQ